MTACAFMPTAPRSLVLVGARGSGKTTVGRLLAQRMGRPFVDLDEQIEQSAGRSVREIFEAHGEPAFRELEAQALRNALSAAGQVVAAGGGIVLREANRKELREHFCVWLKAEPAVLERRLRHDPATCKRRPALTSLPPEDEMRQVLAQRLPLYAEVCHLAVDTTDRPPDQVAEIIVAALQERRAFGGAGP